VARGKGIGAVSDDLSIAPFVRAKLEEWRHLKSRELQAEVEVEIAAYHAREGRVDQAVRAQAQLRREFGHGASPRVSIRLMFLDSCLHYYKSADSKAIDRVSRAQFLSGALHLDDLLALSSAWKAHFCFHAARVGEIGPALALATSSAKAGDLPSLARIAMTLGDLATYLGMFGRARSWYAQAHRNAVALGDHAYISALNFNRPAMTAFAARLHAELGIPLEIDARTVESLLKTSQSYEAIAGITSLEGMQNVASVALSMHVGAFAAARTQISIALSELKGEALAVNRLPLLADLAWCCAVAGETTSAQGHIAAVLESDWSEVDPDDQLIATKALVEAANVVGIELPAPIEARRSCLVIELTAKLNRMRSDLDALWSWQQPEVAVASSQ
jgi:hypothetical protein